MHGSRLRRLHGAQIGPVLSLEGAGGGGNSQRRSRLTSVGSSSGFLTTEALSLAITAPTDQKAQEASDRAQKIAADEKA